MRVIQWSHHSSQLCFLQGDLRWIHSCSVEGTKLPAPILLGVIKQGPNGQPGKAPLFHLPAEPEQLTALGQIFSWCRRVQLHGGPRAVLIYAPGAPGTRQLVCKYSKFYKPVFFPLLQPHYPEEQSLLVSSECIWG